MAAAKTYRKCDVCKEYFPDNGFSSVTLQLHFANNFDAVTCSLPCAVVQVTTWADEEADRLRRNALGAVPA